jgi:hypothetical protein
MRVIVLSAVALAILASPAWGSVADTLPPSELGTLIVGEHIRATFTEYDRAGNRTTRLTASFGELGPEALRLEIVSGEERQARAIPIADLLRLEIGREHRLTGRGALIGGLIGAGLGIAMMSAADSADSADSVIGGALLGGVGTGVGALIGSRRHAIEWREVAVP